MDKHAEDLAQFLRVMQTEWGREQLKQHGIKAKISAEKFAAFLGVPSTTYSEVSRAVRWPISAETLERIADGLDRWRPALGTVAYLKAGRRATFSSRDERLNRLIEYYINATEEQRRALEETLTGRGPEENGTPVQKAMSIQSI